MVHENNMSAEKGFGKNPNAIIKFGELRICAGEGRENIYERYTLGKQ